jgi:hypothetical protein
MLISVIDGSNYFRGLLLLIRKDRQVSPAEAEFMRQVGMNLGFEREFCETAIRDILENTYIEENPPLFSSRDIALLFLRDGLRIAYADDVLHPEEETWLKAAADRNGLDAGVFSSEHAVAAAARGTRRQMEVESLKIRHT